jgi:hypothetical protein
MTTNTITVEFSPRRGRLVVSTGPGIAPMPRVRSAFPIASDALVADWQKHKSTGVSVPGCRGVT